MGRFKGGPLNLPFLFRKMLCDLKHNTTWNFCLSEHVHNFKADQSDMIWLLDDSYSHNFQVVVILRFITISTYIKNKNISLSFNLNDKIV